MPVNVTMPKNGMTMIEGLISKWYKKPGDTVKEGEVLADITTDKIVLSLEATVAGTIAQLLHPEGSTVPVYETIAIIALPGESVEPVIAQKSAVSEVIESNRVSETPGDIAENNVKATPIAKRIAKENNIDLAAIGTGTGPGGRIKEEDVLKYLEKLKEKAVAAAPSVAFAAAPVKAVDVQEPEEYIPLVGIRKVIADNMRKSHDTAVHVTSTTEIDMTDLIALNKKIAPQWEKQYGIKPTLNSYFVKATAMALKEHPIINSSIVDNKIVLKKYYHVGIAVSVGEGLIVPVIRNADKLSVREIAEQISFIVKRANNNQLSPDELQGGTFTISNVGPYLVQIFTPVIVQPQSAILGIGTTTERPVVYNGQIAIRSVANLCLTYDHRIIQGAQGAKFRMTIKELIENPMNLLS